MARSAVGRRNLWSSVQALKTHGVTILAGTDAPLLAPHGFILHHELTGLVEASVSIPVDPNVRPRPRDVSEASVRDVEGIL